METNFKTGEHLDWVQCYLLHLSLRYKRAKHSLENIQKVQFDMEENVSKLKAVASQRVTILLLSLQHFVLTWASTDCLPGKVSLLWAIVSSKLSG